MITYQDLLVEVAESLGCHGQVLNSRASIKHQQFISSSFSPIKVDTSSVEMKDRWFRKIYSFAKLSETVLVGWISGDEARYMEGLKMNVVAETCTAILKKFLADPYVPKPKSCVFTAWYSQPYSRGSYSSIGIGGQQTDVEKVAEPLFQRPMNRTVSFFLVYSFDIGPGKISYFINITISHILGAFVTKTTYFAIFSEFNLFCPFFQNLTCFAHFSGISSIFNGFYNQD